MTKSWVSGGRSVDHADQLRREIADLEEARDELVEKNKKAVFEWCSFILNSENGPRDTEGIRAHPSTQGVKDVLARYYSLSQLIMDNEVLLNEKLDEQAKLDSLA